MQLAVKDVANILNLSERTVYRYAKEGKLPAYRVQDQYRFNRAEVIEWAAANKIRVSPEYLQEPDEHAGTGPSLSEALRQGGIYYGVAGDDKAAVLSAVVQTISLPDGVDRTFLLNVIRAREDLGSTGIGDGIAIPHARDPIVLHVQQPIASLCFLANPVDFAALDGKPVNVLFTLINPTMRQHLHMLSRIAFVIKDDRAKEAILKQEPKDVILDEIVRVEKGLGS